MIKVLNRQLLIPNDERLMGTTYDASSSNRVFQIDRLNSDGVDIADLDFYLDMRFDEARTIYSASKSTTISDGIVFVNKFMLLDKITGTGTRVFTFNGTGWTYGGDVIDIASYGISYTGVPVSGNTITIVITASSGVYDTAELTKEVTEDSINLIWLITESQLMVEGTVHIQIRASRDTRIRWSSYEAAMFVEGHINVPGNYGDISEFQQIEMDAKRILDGINAKGTEAEKWATGEHEGVPVTSTEPQYHNNAKYYAEKASDYADDSADSASASAGSASDAAESASDASDSASAAAGSATSALNSAADAHDSEMNAGASETNAGLSAASAAEKAVLSESWAVGGTDTRTGEDTNNSAYFSGKAEAAVDHYPQIRFVSEEPAGYYWFVWDALNEAWVNTGVRADGGSSGGSWGTITGDLQNQADLWAQLGLKYVKPSGGIPDTDLSSDVQGSLDNADSAYQKPGTGIPESDLEQDVKDILDSAILFEEQTITDAQKLQARENIGLGNVDNTSDADKPVSTEQQTALNAKIDKVSGIQNHIPKYKADGGLEDGYYYETVKTW